MQVLRLSTFIPLSLLLVAPSICRSEESEYHYRDSPDYHALSAADRSKLDQVVKDLRSIETAICKYMREHDGDAPKKLDALVPKYISTLPRDPFATPDSAPKKRNEHYKQAMGGLGYLYRWRAGPSVIKTWNPLTFHPKEDAWEVKSVGLENFPLRYRSENGRGLFCRAGYWGRLTLDVF